MRTRSALLVALIVALGACSAGSSRGPVATAKARVLRVGTWKGKPGGFSSIQAAVNAARPGDWVLVAPGDYHESPRARIGVHISTPNIHLRGLDRNTVIVDGTLPGAPEPCDAQPGWQNRGPAAGRNGIVVDHVSGVSIDNLTVCNFVGHDTTGIQVSFDGGYTTDRIGLGAFEGSYLSATSSSASADRTSLASWGVFVSNTRGPGSISHSYASNMADSAFHIGSCADCDTVFDHDVARHSVIGFAAINAGGRLRVEHSEIADNSAGIDLASEQDLSAPPPQDGACPEGRRGPVSASPDSCTIVSDNMVEGNNNANVPGGSEQGGTLTFLGAGVYIAGGRHDTVVGNTVLGQGSYGIAVLIYPWTGPPVTAAGRCQGGNNLAPGQLCLFNAYGNTILGNTLSENGSFGNPTNGDLAEATISHDPGNCFTGNHGPKGEAISSSPALLQQPRSACGAASGGAVFGPLGVQIACATRALGPCADGKPASALGSIRALAGALHGNVDALNAPGIADMAADYPTASQVTAPAAPSQPSMSDACTEVPTNPWC